MSKLSKAQKIGQCKICGLIIYRFSNNKYVGHSDFCKNKRTGNLDY